MKIIAALLLTFAITQAVQVSMTTDLSKEKFTDLKKTGWGRIAMNLLELQMATNGPVAELITAFQNLIRDLNFKVGTTQEQYRWDKAEHWELDKTINTRLRDAKVRFGVATAHLQNSLYPYRAELEGLIAQDEALVASTEADMERSTADRNTAQAKFEVEAAEHADAIGAVNECIQLVRGLMSGSAGMVELKQAKVALKKMTSTVKQHSAFGHLAATLVALSQEFVDASAAGRVMDLLEELLSNLQESEYQLNVANDQSIAAYEAYMAVCRQTVLDAESRIDSNTAALEVCNAEIAHQEELRDTAEADRDQAQEELEIETARWDAYVASYEDLMAQLMSEMDSIDRVIDVFANADLSSEMMDAVDQ